MNATFENPVDRENHIVRGVKVLGFTSANGRIYDFAAVKEAIQKYEKAPVNKDHNMEEPSFSDRLGWLENVILEKDGLYADFHYNPHADGIESFLWFAEHNGLGDVGFSHLVSGKYSVDPDGTERITRIDKVRSVDLVANPATTKTIFESEFKPMPKKVVKEAEYFSKGTKISKSDLKRIEKEADAAYKKVQDTVFKTTSEYRAAQGRADVASEMYEEALKLYKAQQNKGSESMKEADSDVPEKFPVGKKLLVYFTRSLPNQKGLSDSTLSTSFQSKFSYDNWIRQNKNKVDIVSIKWVGASNNKESESMKENDSDFKIVEKMSGTKDDQVSKREKTYDLYYKGKFIGWVDDLAKAWRIEKEYANKKGSESVTEAVDQNDAEKLNKFRIYFKLSHAAELLKGKPGFSAAYNKAAKAFKDYSNVSDAPNKGSESMKEAEKEKGLEVYGTKGMKNTRFRKTFKSQKEYEKWYDKNEGDIEILGLRDLEGDSKREQEDDDDSGLTDKEKADNLRAAKLQDRKMAASRRKNSGDDDGRRGYGPTGTTRTNRARRRESVKEAKQPSQGSEMTVKQLTDLFKDGEWEAYSDVVPNKHVTLVNKSKNKKVNVLVREQGDDEMDKEKMMEDENPMQQEEAEQDPMMDEVDDVYSKIKEVCEGEGSDEEKSKQVLEMLGLSGGMSEAEDDEEMKEEDDEETKEQDSEVLEKENDDEEMKEEDDEDPKKESKSELKSLRKWKSEKLKQEKIVNLIKESNLEPTRVFVKQLSAIDSKLWGEAIRDRKKVALTRSAVKPISSGSQSRSELSYKQFLESVLGK